MRFDFSLDFARKMDADDPIRELRSEFVFPQHKGESVVYLTGNSLGLMPKSVRTYLDEEMEDWGTHGVEGHFRARRPWVAYHEFFAESLARLVGAKPTEVVAMNGLTPNLHLLLVSFYRPEGKRIKILCEQKAFPSDQYALASQLRFHGIAPEDGLIELSPRSGEHHLQVEDILSTIDRHADEIALVMIGGVNYYTGQRMDMPAITAHAKKYGIMVGFDLAHAAGNIELALHDWGVDFAAWCSYKYLNSGPGSVSGVFIHERHHGLADIPRFEGWWGHDRTRRFLMEPQFVPMPTAEAWQLSNAPVFAMAPHRAALDVFDKVSLPQLFKKRDELTAYLEFVIDTIGAKQGAAFEIITPREKKQRGAQLSVFLHGYDKSLFNILMGKGVIADWREPNVIRMAPAPLYVSFEDVYRFGCILDEALEELK
jgi:kynureninase